MNKIIASTCFIAAFIMYPRASHATIYYFQQDLGVHNLMHYCRYSNGKVYTFNATELCPNSIEEEGLSFGQVQEVGFLVGQYQDGMTKVCVYNVMNVRRAVRISSTELCPNSYQF
jgi:hypothetical protein